MTKRLFAFFRYTAIITIVASLFVLGGCGGDEDPAPTKTLYELISEDATLTKIKAQIDLNADLKAKLSGTGTFTFFAPNDLAMGAILTTLNLTDFSSISPSTLSAVLNYHLVNSSKTSADLTKGAKVTTAQGEDITIDITSTGVVKLVTGATTQGTVVTADVKATNGVLHVVGDYPLVPPTIGGLIVATLGKVAQPILLSATFSTLASAILKADAATTNASEKIVSLMVGQTAQTFFAVPNAVFTAGSITVDTYTAAQWNAIIKGHMIPSESIATLAAGTKTTINGKTLTLTTTTVKGAGNSAAITVVTSSKITTANGVIYPIQGVIVNP